MEFEPDTRLIKKFVKWIERFDRRHARNWAKLYHVEPEAAMCEATYWGLLTDCGVEVEPNANLAFSMKAPDYVCQKDGHTFYVEVTCIKIDTATNKTSLSHVTPSSFQHYARLNDAIFSECRQKTPQCSSVSAPCLVAVGTFHHTASTICVAKHHLEDLLTGEPLLAWNFDGSRGEAVGDPYVVTHLRSAAFLMPSEGKAALARSPISGVLVGGFGCRPPDVYGLLHPNPGHAFDRALLDRIEFCRLSDGYETGDLSVEWC
jgi:hypothetical protein